MLMQFNSKNFNKTLGKILTAIAIVLILVLTFIKLDEDRKATFLCDEVSKSNLDMKQCPVHTSNVSWILAGGFGIGFLLLAIGIYLWLMGSVSNSNINNINNSNINNQDSNQEIEKNQATTFNRDFKIVDISKLDDNERKIYEFLKLKEGSVYQSDILKETLFSKVKTTRVLDRLEMKGIVERKRRGMTNLVVLK